MRAPYQTVPVVNMAGKLIGLIPKSFLFVLVENHQWYNEKIVSKRGKDVSEYYRTSKNRMDSVSSDPAELKY